MRTNLEKWNYYLGIIKQKEIEFIENNIDDIPDKLYYVYPTGKIDVLNVVGVDYNDRLFYEGKKPTRKDVARIKEYSDNIPEFTKDRVLIHWERKESEYTVSGADRYTKLQERYILTWEEAKQKAQQLKKEKEREEELLKNGHIKCSYCGKVVPEEESISYNIIFQNSKPDPFSRKGYKRFVDNKTNQYCSEKCGVHDQMAHEG